MGKAKKSVIITKASGEQEAFDVNKFRNSLKHTRANKKVIEQIIQEVKHLLYAGITTKEIYSKAFSLLQNHTPFTAARYKLKKAIMELGPTGYPFEKFVGEILSQQGFETKIGVIVQGSCVQHEVDVVAEKAEKHFMIECKFHNEPGRKCNVKIPLYIHSRFKDLEVEWQKRPGHKLKFHQGWVVNNTHFTSDAIQYGECAGLKLIGWKYPKENSLKLQIDRSGLHPITCLTTLHHNEKQKLLDQNKVLCKELCLNPHLLSAIGVSKDRHHIILTEAEQVCEK